MSKVSKVDIVIPVHNNFEITKRCVETVLDSVYENTSRIGQLIIVDDQSTEGDLKEYFNNEEGNFYYPPAEVDPPYINFVKTPERFYYSKAVNYGYNFVTSKYMMLLTNDTKVYSRDWVKTMIQEFEEEENVGLLGPGVVGYYNPEPVMNKGFDYTRIGGFCWLIESSYFGKIGGLREDDQYTHWHSDMEFCDRIIANGKKIGVSSAFIHHGGGWSNKFVESHIPKG